MNISSFLIQEYFDLTANSLLSVKSVTRTHPAFLSNMWKNWQLADPTNRTSFEIMNRNPLTRENFLKLINALPKIYNQFGWKYRGLDAKITHKVSSTTFIASPWSADMIGPGENFIVTGILWNAKSWIQIICLH